MNSLFAKLFFLNQKIKKSVYGVNWIFLNETRFSGRLKILRSKILLTSPVDFGDVSQAV